MNSQQTKQRQNNRRQFIQKFKTQVQDSCSIDSFQTPQKVQVKNKLFSSTSPIRKHSLERKKQIKMPQSRTDNTKPDSECMEKLTKPKIKLMPPRLYRQTSKKDINAANSPQSKILFEDSFNNILSKLFQDMQFQRQNQTNAEIKDSIITLGVLFENVNKLKSTQMFKKESQKIDLIVKSMIMKLQQKVNTEYSKKQPKASFDSGQRPAYQLLKPLKKDNSSFMEQKTHTSSSKKISRLSSFKIQNEQTHQNELNKIHQLYRHNSKMLKAHKMADLVK